ncbi:RNA 2',3'-cyclic phosphodiesterase [Halosegnis marinus]|uniref:RNA 2',3'-cyclic phosphodiesterase n=1 Tax=Halosegnis marinus TaxID=3034023 RepID=A0ABD5ZMZ4_9EURY|nr:RNA 2',3'-cyclic phosphodiesterase [Halosegnis sp. DT85]
MRAFVSADLDDLTDAVAATQEPLDHAGVDPVAPEGAHVTVKFLGEVDDPDPVVAALERAVADAGVEPFTAEVGGYGVFPSPEYISVIWAGVRGGSDELTRLHEAVERETTALGFDPEEHEFTPHVTLARMRDARSKSVIREVVTERDPTLGEQRVEELRLTESTLTDDGPRYETVARVPL